MCEYCGCQEVTAIGELTREHDEVVGLMAHVRAAHTAGDVAAMAGLARLISDILRPHTAVEEQGLFPLLAAEFPDQVAVLCAEHRHIEAVLGAAAVTVPTDPDWPDALLAVLQDLRVHILKEQDGVFPAALTTLDATSWDTVDAVRAREGSGLLGRLQR
ncbi:hemerythrin domain-containing protein [Actinoplanes xinjiangensis]|uniref:Hemerythrin HHE cation binding domain-containing protein n=1 Tax=Actinoplanes xinjiangensis TaxID=512350 RepID=A0A316E7D3_9ACTN|nr:hemerythrin domain-containing protein [Actinoplanes xinjiangensis]PWK26618.1 hemerythrin HHE cation binding domain-containing protein [Actinoplanes xinjiangensis]GIF45379.1 hemerythrin [Actinoplanes xinjiangensis]